MAKTLLSFCGLFMMMSLSTVEGNSHAKRLYNNLLVKSGYNKLIRPVANNSDTLTVKLGLRLSQLIGVDEKNQIMTTNVWLSQEWMDLNFKWNPDDYGGVEVLYVPSESLWLPDIVLFNNADGNYQVTLMTKATVYYTGRVVWEPPAIYKSTCTIDVEFFPFDEQTCVMKFGSWTYNGFQVELKHKDQVDFPGNVDISMAIDLSGYYRSFIWDLLKVPARRNKVYYECCPEPYPDVTFEVTIRRKTLFYTINLIIPSVAISFLTVFVFYLPADSGEKITLCISILLSLTVFFLLLADLIPPTSLVVPLIGKYLLFTMILVTLSVIITVVVLNIDNRSEATHTMTPWVRKLCLQILPALLLIRRPQVTLSDVRKPTASMKDAKKILQRLNGTDKFATPPLSSHSPTLQMYHRLNSSQNGPGRRQLAPAVERALDNVRFIADHLKEEEKTEKIQEDWKYVALVVDRLFFWLFTTACLLGTFGIILQAPTLYASTKPMDVGI